MGASLSSHSDDPPRWLIVIPQVTQSLDLIHRPSAHDELVVEGRCCASAPYRVLHPELQVGIWRPHVTVVVPLLHADTRLPVLTVADRGEIDVSYTGVFGEFRGDLLAAFFGPLLVQCLAAQGADGSHPSAYRRERSGVTAGLADLS